jgi:hypothetical protein
MRLAAVPISGSCAGTRERASQPTRGDVGPVGALGSAALAHLDRLYGRTIVRRTTVSPATSSPMTQPGTLSAPRITPSTPPRAITAIDAESLSVTRAGTVGARFGPVPRPRGGSLRGSRAVRASWATGRWRRRSVRSAERRSAAETNPSDDVPRSAAASRPAALSPVSSVSTLGLDDADDGGFTSRGELAGMVPSLALDKQPRTRHCESRSACVRYAAGPRTVRSDSAS